MRWLVALGLVIVPVGCGPLGSSSGDDELGTSTPVVREFGLIRGGDPAARTIQFDRAEFLTGAAAQRAAEADGAVAPGERVPNDYYIRNPDRDVVELKIVPTTQIRGAAPVTDLDRGKRPPCDSCTSYPLSVDAFFKAFPLEPDRAIRAWVTTEGAVATKIEEQYVP